MQASDPAPRRFLPPLALAFGVMAAIATGLVVAIAATGSLHFPDYSAEAFFFRHQDLPMLAADLAILAGLALTPVALLARAGGARLSARTLVLGLAAICLVAGALGVTLVFCDYTFSLDEFLANFDAKIFASGRVLALVPPEWRPFEPALQPIYMLPLPDSVWASSYLPVNAALRALGQIAHLQRWVNPALSAFSIVAAYAVGRRLWPDRPGAAVVAAALLGASSQLIVMSMTAYAMPAHLAFNLAWLWLFLRGGRLGHAGALAVGLLATGLHQILFHPLFVAPFVLRLWFHRRWGVAILYTLAYAAICGFWVEYWQLVTPAGGVAAADSDATGIDYFIDRLSDAFPEFHARHIGVMAQCLARFVAWQAPLAAPLAVIGGIWAIWTRGPARPLALGVLLTLIAVFAATPTQTHGWGYRYLHGLLGSICLIAGWTWSRLTERLAARERTAAAGAVAVVCAVSLLVLTPVRAWQAWSYVHPFAAANAAIQGAKAEVVVVDHNSDVLFDMGTLTRNDPFLARGPKVMALGFMNDDMVRQLCATHSVVVFNGQSARDYHVALVPWRGDRGIARLRSLMRQLNCYKPMQR